MLKCRQIVDLAFISPESSISLTNRWQIKFHLLMCKTCNRYVKQLNFIQKTAGVIDRHCQDIVMPGDIRNRIKKNLAAVQKQHEP